MITVVPKIDTEEVRKTQKELAAEGVSIPEPKSVTVKAGEDHEGDPAYFLTVTFGKQHKVKDIPWMRFSPLRWGIESPSIPQWRQGISRDFQCPRAR